MKNLAILLLAAFLCLSACAPQGNSGGASTNTPGSSQDGQGTKSADPGQMASAHDCGAPQIDNCTLLGLTPVQLMTVREDMSQQKEPGAMIKMSEQEKDVLRAGQLIQQMQYRAMHALADFTESDAADFEDFFNSIQWK